MYGVYRRSFDRENRVGSRTIDRMTKKFQRRIEDFDCVRCGALVKGDGYTNHCPKCLWSKHVDVNPGDRVADCGALMEPVALEGASPEYTLVHRCVRCRHEKRNKLDAQDDMDAVMLIIAHPQK